MTENETTILAITAKLADEIILLARDAPGRPDADVVIRSSTFLRWLDMAEELEELARKPR